MNNDIGPNDRCPCGAGKKYKKCHGSPDRRIRSLNIIAEFDGIPVSEVLMAREPVTSEIVFFYKGLQVFPKSVAAGMNYNRASGSSKQKVTVWIPLPNRRFTEHDVQRVQEKFHYVMAVDTNTRNINGEKASVCVATLYRNEAADGGGSLFLATRVVIEFRGATENPEKIGWWLMINRLPPRPPGARIGVVTDAHLDSLIEINSRRLPILENFYLPSDCVMIYASDKHSDSSFNEVLSISDKQADEVLKWTQTHPSSQGFVADIGAPYRVRRTWSTSAIDWIFINKRDPAAIGEWYIDFAK